MLKNSKFWTAILLLVLTPSVTGCYFTQAQAMKELGPMQNERYASYTKAKAETVRYLAELLAKADRGGTRVEVDGDGRVKAFVSTERLDLDKLIALAEMQAYKEQPVQGFLSEAGDFVAKATPLAAVGMVQYYSHANTKVQSDANVRVTESNNARDAAIWAGYTGNFANTVTTTTTDTNTSVTELTDISDTVNTSVTELTDISDTTNTSVTEVSNSSTEVSSSDTTNTTVDSSNNTDSTVTNNDSSNNTVPIP